VARDCGGSFGMKNVPYPEYAILLWASRRAGVPLRWTSGRLESFQSDAHARDQWVDADLALDGEGRFLALRVEGCANLGAYVGPTTPHSPTNNVGGLAGVYRTPHIHVRINGAMTNTQSTAAYRGAGRPEATYIIERMIDLAAAQLGIDRVELRRRNMIGPEQMPYKTGLTFTYDSGDFPALLDKAMAAADWNGFRARQAASAAKGRLRGLGIANPIEIAGGPTGKPHPEYAKVIVSPGGAIRIESGSADTGQGHRTAFSQLVCDRLDVEPSTISLVTGDTASVAKGTGSFGSRTLAAAGAVIGFAIDKVLDKMAPQAAELLEAEAKDVVFSGGYFAVPGTNRRARFQTVAAALQAPVDGEVWDSTQAPTFPNGCHVCEVEVDPETGHVSLDRYVVVDDVGTVVNPMLVKGQIVGGVAQGLGQALLEQIVYDDETGQLLSASFMDYGMPRAYDLPFVTVETFPVPTKSNPLGVKGAGEAGTVGGLAVVMSAICDALGQAGVEHIDMPATPARVWRAIQEARAA
jgi:carbon-monoxide dehydrogenase large subunit